jgi:hypothetical protein
MASDDLLAVTETAASTKSATGSGLKAACPPATTSGCRVVRSRAVQRDAGEVEAVSRLV